MSSLPNDPVMLLSVMNTKLRDHYEDLVSCCDDLNVNKDEIEMKLRNINYEYDTIQNQFV